MEKMTTAELVNNYKTATAHGLGRAIKEIEEQLTWNDQSKYFTPVYSKQDKRGLIEALKEEMLKREEQEAKDAEYYKNARRCGYRSVF